MIGYTLTDLVREYEFEVGNSTTAKFARSLQYGISTLRDLHIDISGVVKIVYLDVDPNLHVVELPADYLRYTKIGIVGADGLIHSLGLDNRIANPIGTDTCGAMERTTSDVAASTGFFISVDWSADNYRNGEFTGRMFGVGGGNNRYGYYKLDLEQGLIVFNTDFAINKVVLEYIGSFTDASGDYQVHPFLLDAIKAGIYLRSIQRDRNSGLGEKQLAMETYKTEKNKSKARLNNNTKEEWLQAFRRHFTLAPKF